MNKEINNIVYRVISEEIEKRIDIIKNKIFEDKKMKKQVCSECGSKNMFENECMECGYTMESDCMECGYNENEFEESFYEDEVRESKKLSKGQKYIAKQSEPYDEIDADDFKKLRAKKKEMKERLYGNQHRIDMNKNNKIDSQDFKMLRNKKHKVEENHYSITINNKRYVFVESEMIDLIENIVLEEKKKKKKTNKTKSNKDVIRLTKTTQDKSKKENDDYLDSVVKKMKDYIKDGSKGEYEMNPKHFPKGNGELAKMSKMAYIPSDAVGEYVDNFTAAGLENLDYDAIHPNEDWVDDLIMGSSRTGNNPKWANSVETPVNKKRNQIRKDNLLAKVKRKAYNKSPQPVIGDKSGNETDKASKIMMKLESENERKVMSDMEKMKTLISYDKKTQ
jgi:hypothetical protein